jgi:hypothetical protein
MGSRLNSLPCLVELARRSGSFQRLAFADHLISPLNEDRRRQFALSRPHSLASLPRRLAPNPACPFDDVFSFHFEFSGSPAALESEVPGPVSSRQKIGHERAIVLDVLLDVTLDVISGGNADFDRDFNK